MLTLHKVYPTAVIAAMYEEIAPNLNFFPELFENYPNVDLNDMLWIADFGQGIETTEVSGTSVSLAETQQDIGYAYGTPLRVEPYDFAIFTIDFDSSNQLYILADQWDDA